ncbi:MAG TPA: hypothetical protein VM222_02855 [Planctomycetota bacterium]|nr:hypothetical protein [Planctomycetota bacterium]
MLPGDPLPGSSAPAPITRSQAALRLARDIAPRILRGQLSVEQGALEIFDLMRRCSPEEVPSELRVFESWTSRGEGGRAASPEYAQAIVEWAWEMTNQEPGS